MVRAHAINAVDPGSIPAGGTFLHVTSPLSLPYFCLLLNKGVYAKINVSVLSGVSDPNGRHSRRECELTVQI